jgi:hypothetical protein
MKTSPLKLTSSRLSSTISLSETPSLKMSLSSQCDEEDDFKQSVAVRNDPTVEASGKNYF